MGVDVSMVMVFVELIDVLSIPSASDACVVGAVDSLLIESAADGRLMFAVVSTSRLAISCHVGRGPAVVELQQGRPCHNDGVAEENADEDVFSHAILTARGRRRCRFRVGRGCVDDDPSRVRKGSVCAGNWQRGIDAPSEVVADLTDATVQRSDVDVAKAHGRVSGCDHVGELECSCSYAGVGDVDVEVGRSHV
eukprot:scaffold162_cov275-Pinguiococcus_pyrenoidosus.AAC.4